LNYQVYMTYNTDSQGNRVSDKIYNETYSIYSNRLVLNQIPDDYDGVSISHGSTQLTEIKNQAKVLAEDEFYVDYSTGMVFFNPILDKATVNVIEYSGIGYISYPADRIYTKLEGGTISKTLGDIIDTQVREFIFSTEAAPADASAYKEGSVWFTYQDN